MAVVVQLSDAAYLYIAVDMLGALSITIVSATHTLSCRLGADVQFSNNSGQTVASPRIKAHKALYFSGGILCYRPEQHS
jgi:hypothetical protein